MNFLKVVLVISAYLNHKFGGIDLAIVMLNISVLNLLGVCKSYILPNFFTLFFLFLSLSFMSAGYFVRGRGGGLFNYLYSKLLLKYPRLKCVDILKYTGLRAFIFNILFILLVGSSIYYLYHVYEGGVPTKVGGESVFNLLSFLFIIIIHQVPDILPIWFVLSPRIRSSIIYSFII